MNLQFTYHTNHANYKAGQSGLKTKEIVLYTHCGFQKVGVVVVAAVVGKLLRNGWKSRCGDDSKDVVIVVDEFFAGKVRSCDKLAQLKGVGFLLLNYSGGVV